MRVEVDRTICGQHFQCVFSAPEIFSMDGNGELEYVERPDESLRDSAELAAQVCPTMAITVTND